MFRAERALLSMVTTACTISALLLFAVVLQLCAQYAHSFQFAHALDYSQNSPLGASKSTPSYAALHLWEDSQPSEIPQLAPGCSSRLCHAYELPADVRLFPQLLDTSVAYRASFTILSIVLWVLFTYCAVEFRAFPNILLLLWMTVGVASCIIGFWLL